MPRPSSQVTGAGRLLKPDRGSVAANRPLGGFAGEQYEVEVEVVGAADLVQECLVSADDGVLSLRPVGADRGDVGAGGC